MASVVDHVVELVVRRGEAVTDAVARSFADPDVLKLTAHVGIGDTVALDALDVAGFRREGLLHDALRSPDGELTAEVLFGLTRRDWSRPVHEFEVIAFDADDTLWRSEDSFDAAERAFVDLLGPYVDEGIDVKAALTAVERKNLHQFGYGVKAFGLSMVQCATTISPERVPPSVIGRLIETTRAMLDEPVQLLAGVGPVLDEVGRSHRLVLITKGDLIHQSSKVEASGLAHHFEQIEIVMEKDPPTYARILGQIGVSADRFCMVGNSVRSDILPVLSLGGSAVHVPYPLLWDLEEAPTDHGHTFAELGSISEFPRWLAERAATASTTARDA